MTFNSAIFLAFALVFFALWPLVRQRPKSRYIFIVTLSLFFYGWWDWRFVPLLVGTGLVDFYAALLMTKYPKHRRTLLVVSLVSNLGVLGVFKYFNFFAENLQSLSHVFGWSFAPSALSIVLPLGISFYTFASMSYTIDVYKGHFKATHDIWHFLAFLSLFCHLVAGPILRAADLMPQMERVHRPNEEERWEGFKLVVLGFFKKIVLADNLALAVDTAFGGTVTGGSAFWWVAVTMFAFQIYYDFSGYSDIARGLAKWMGYEFMLNFDHPYWSKSLREFWTRWHISLSTWFRDYVYIPLGGSKGGVWFTLRNLWITMLLSGFWHGANWTFVFWGALHAFYLSLERLTNWPERLQATGGGRLLSWTITLVLVWVSWVFFRAESLTQVGRILGTMFSFRGAELPISAAALSFLGVGIAMEFLAWALRQRWLHLGRAFAFWWQPSFLALVIVANIFLRGTGNTFIYFNF